MIEAYCDLGIFFGVNSLDKLSELHEAQTEYLRELNIPSEIWVGMSKCAQDERLSLIMERFNEIDLVHDINKYDFFSNLFSSELVESYRKSEAPLDFVQIEHIASVLAHCEELKFEYWRDLELADKVEVLNKLEFQIASIEHRPPCQICTEDLGCISISEQGVNGYLGGYNSVNKSITLNTALLESSHPAACKEILDTLAHEGRHAYQDYNVNVFENHSRHSEVVSWSDTIGGGKWSYWGDTSTLIGQRLYEQQSIEIDARNFATDILDKFMQKTSM